MFEKRKSYTNQMNILNTQLAIQEWLWRETQIMDITVKSQLVLLGELSRLLGEYGEPRLSYDGLLM